MSVHSTKCYIPITIELPLSPEMQLLSCIPIMTIIIIVILYKYNYNYYYNSIIEYYYDLNYTWSRSTSAFLQARHTGFSKEIRQQGLSRHMHRHVHVHVIAIIVP